MKFLLKLAGTAQTAGHRYTFIHGGQTLMKQDGLSADEVQKHFEDMDLNISLGHVDGELCVLVDGEEDFVQKTYDGKAPINDVLGPIESITSLDNNDSVTIEELTRALDRHAEATIKYVYKPEQIYNFVEVTLSGNKDQETINKIVEEGVLSEEDIKMRVAQLNKYNLAPETISKIISKMQMNPLDKARVPNHSFVYKPQGNEVETLYISYLLGHNILLEGGKAAGKNTLIEDVALMMNQPLYEIQVNSQITDIDILGTKTIELVGEFNDEMRKEVNKCFNSLQSSLNDVGTALALGEASEEERKELLENIIKKENSDVDFSVLVEALRGGETVVKYEPSPLIQGMMNGGIVVLDEINTGHPSVMAVLNPVLDDRKRIDVPGFKQVEAHPDFRLFGTMNMGYAGTISMNDATSSRFRKIVMEPADSILEILEARVPELDESLAIDMDKIYTEIRIGTLGNNGYGGSLSSESINVRAFIRAAEAVVEGLPLLVALEDVINSSDDYDEREAVRGIVNSYIA